MVQVVEADLPFPCDLQPYTSTMSAPNPKAFPLADATLTNQVHSSHSLPILSQRTRKLTSLCSRPLPEISFSFGGLDPGPCATGFALQAAQEGSQRGYQDPQPRYLRVHHHDRRYVFFLVLPLSPFLCFHFSSFILFLDWRVGV
jgi:hypothetical protein